MVGDVPHRGVKAGEVSAYFRMRHRARPIQGNLINWTVKGTVTEKSKLFIRLNVVEGSSNKKIIPGFLALHIVDFHRQQGHCKMVVCP